MKFSKESKVGTVRQQPLQERGTRLLGGRAHSCCLATMGHATAGQMQSVDSSQLGHTCNVRMCVRAPHPTNIQGLHVQGRGAQQARLGALKHVC
eukprot:1139481-Pelagomonas_calceolata.AAC.2